MTAPTPSPLPPTDEELHALVDGRLAPGQATQLQSRLDADPGSAETVAAWRDQRDRLRAHLADALREPLPPHHLAAAAAVQQHHEFNRRASQWGRMAAAVLLAFGAGWLAHGQWQGPGAAGFVAGGPAGFARQALVAHAVYAPEQRHPVEVGAAEQDHLVQWLSRRLGRPLRLPQLGAEGFELVGGRLLPGDSGARAQFMFQSTSGERLTLYIGAVPSGAGPETVEFRFMSEAGNSSFYWVDRGFGYALSGPMPRPQLMKLARLAHQSLQP